VAASSFGLTNSLQFDAQFPVEAVEIGEREHAFDFDVVGLVETIPVLRSCAARSPSLVRKTTPEAAYSRFPTG
jgi:hypothetical protein